MTALTALAAASAPSLLAYNLSPSPTYLNQALALALWSVHVLACGVQAPGRDPPLTPTLSLALALLAAAVGSWALATLPLGLALSALGLLVAAWALAAAGSAARRARHAAPLFTAFATAWLIAGLLNAAVALIQVFAPGLADGDWIATSNLPGRAVGNLRQPNHLASLLLWAAIGAVALVEMGQLARRVAAVVMTILIFGVVLTASRTGFLGVLLLALWGALDRKLAPRTRLMLLAAPALYALGWFAMAQWAEMTQKAFGGTERVAEGVAEAGSRFAIWSQALALTRESPWFGVGFGEFNFAWTLTPFPDRPRAFFDHTHNLPVHLAVELGVPLAAAVMGLLVYALWRAARAAWAGPGTAPAAPAAGEAGQTDAAAAQAGARAAVMMVVLIGVHSLLEYPLWYAYFLLPAAWAWGFALGSARPANAAIADASGAEQAPGTRGAAGAPQPGRVGATGLRLAAAAIIVGTAFSVFDYTRVVVIFSSNEGAPPLAQRIEAGRRSVFFSHHADYAAVTSGVGTRDPAASFANTTHYLLDGRLMVAWAEWLEAQGKHDLSRHLAARLREFRSPDAAEFFALCPDKALPAAEAMTKGLPFQCQVAARQPHWREYLRR